MTANPGPGEFDAWNEAMSRKYDPHLFHTRSTLLVRLLEAARVKWVLRYVDPQTPDRILEVGCGAGDVLERITCGELDGVDLSSYMVESARRRLGGRARIHKADAERLPFPDGSFTKVLCTEVLEHVLHPDRVVAEIARVLAPQGRFIVSVPNEGLIRRVKTILTRVRVASLTLKKRGGYEPPDVNEWHLHEFDRAMLSAILQPLFRIERLRGLPSAILPVHYVALCRKPNLSSSATAGAGSR
jgi:SAM-dependent methyltransferase